MHGPMLACGGCTWFAESMEQLGDNLREVRPTLFFGRAAGVGEDPGQDRGRRRRGNPALQEEARGVGARVGAGRAATPSSGASRGRCSTGWPTRWCSPRSASGWASTARASRWSRAAPISRSTLEFFLSLGVPIYEVYGMSECTGPATISLPGPYQHRQGGRSRSRDAS